jgi:hypothetical protein
MIVELTFAELLYAAELAIARRTENRAAGIKDQLRARGNKMSYEGLGAVAEIAWAKLTHTLPDITTTPRSAGADNIWRGARIDIKSTNREHGRLLMPTSSRKRLGDIDLYVLAIIDGAKVRFAGWAAAPELLRDETITDLGYGPTFALGQHELHPVEWLFGMPKTIGARREAKRL